MPSKTLRCVKEEACIGCGLCVLAASRITKEKNSIADSPIRVERRKGEGHLFSIEIDEATRDQLAPVAEVCPRDCFEVDTNE